MSESILANVLAIASCSSIAGTISEVPDITALEIEITLMPCIIFVCVAIAPFNP